MVDTVEINVESVNNNVDVGIESADEIVTLETQVIYGPSGKDATINGFNVATINGGTNIEVVSSDNIITINNMLEVVDVIETGNMSAITSNKVAEVEAKVSNLESQIGDISTILTEINGE